MTVRSVRPDDLDEWLRMRAALWPECATKQHRVEVQQLLDASDESYVAVFDRGDAHLGGFAEVTIRQSAEGAVTSPVAYLEGWYVDGGLREQGVGRQLLAHVEAWARLRGLSELASDAELDNAVSIAAHQACEYREIGRVVQFVKSLTDQSPKR